MAAFFAFHDAKEDGGTRIEIDHFQERVGGVNLCSYNSTALTVIGPFGESHERQVRQQSAYTMCVKDADQSGSCVNICSHEEFFKNVRTSNAPYQRLIRYTIPASEKRVAMRDLERMNITEVSLFGGEDAMARTLFRRTVDWLDDQ